MADSLSCWPYLLDLSGQGKGKKSLGLRTKPSAADSTLHNTVYSSIIQYNTVQYSTVPGHTAQIAVARHPMLFPGGHRSELAWPRTASP